VTLLGDSLEQSKNIRHMLAGRL